VFDTDLCQAGKGVNRIGWHRVEGGWHGSRLGKTVGEFGLRGVCDVFECQLTFMSPQLCKAMVAREGALANIKPKLRNKDSNEPDRGWHLCGVQEPAAWLLILMPFVCQAEQGHHGSERFLCKHHAQVQERRLK
jgi:hypothetical protein